MTPPSSASIGELFGFVRRFVPETLLDGAGWEQLLARIGHWPGSAIMSSVAGFEFRLWEAGPSADFIPSVWTSSALVDFLVERGRAAPTGLAACSVGRFLVADERRRFGRASGLLEYDVVGVPSGERPDPGLFVNVGPHPENAGAPPPGEVVGLLADALCLKRDDDERRAVERVCEALPTGAFAKSLGAMPSRARRAVRIQVDGIAAGGVAGIAQPDRLGRADPACRGHARRHARCRSPVLARVGRGTPRPAAAHRSGDQPLHPRFGQLRRVGWARCEATGGR